MTYVFDEPAGLFLQEQAGRTALKDFEDRVVVFRLGTESCELDYAQMAIACTALAESAAALAGQLHRTAACYAMARAIGDEESEAAQ